MQRAFELMVKYHGKFVGGRSEAIWMQHCQAGENDNPPLVTPDLKQHHRQLQELDDAMIDCLCTNKVRYTEAIGISHD